MNRDPLQAADFPSLTERLSPGVTRRRSMSAMYVRRRDRRLQCVMRIDRTQMGCVTGPLKARVSRGTRHCTPTPADRPGNPCRARLARGLLRGDRQHERNHAEGWVIEVIGLIEKNPPRLVHDEGGARRGAESRRWMLHGVMNIQSEMQIHPAFKVHHAVQARDMDAELAQVESRMRAPVARRLDPRCLHDRMIVLAIAQFGPYRVELVHRGWLDAHQMANAGTGLGFAAAYGGSHVELCIPVLRAAEGNQSAEHDDLDVIFALVADRRGGGGRGGSRSGRVGINWRLCLRSGRGAGDRRQGEGEGRHESEQRRCEPVHHGGKFNRI